MTTENRPTGVLATLAEFRRQIAIGLAVAAVVLAVLAIWWAVRSWPTRAEAEKPSAKDVSSAEKPAPEKKPAEPSASVDYLPAAVWAGFLAILCGISAFWLLSQPLRPGNEATAIRTELLTFGSLAGFVTAMLGLLLGFRWDESLFRWINEDQVQDAKWVLIAASIFTAGLIVMFLSLQLARTEERSNVMLRRALYGFNSVFLGLLLVMVLIAANVFSFLKLPSTLVTNDSAFTSLSDPAKTFLRSLDRPVHVYLILPEHYVQNVDVPGGQVAYTQLYSDCRGLLSQCERQSRNFTASYLSPGLDAVRIAALFDRLKVADKDRDQLGLLIAVGENEDVTSFIPSRDLVDYNIDQQGRSIIFVFQGESKLLNELIYLTDSRSKEVVYVTQDHDELSIDSNATGKRTMAAAIQYLRDKKVRIEPLDLDSKEPKVPDDAACVLVAGPHRTIADDSPTMKALREYLVPTKPGVKPGKLLAYLPAFRAATGNKVAPSGLESLLRDFALDVPPDQRVMCVPRQFQPIQGLGYIPANTALGVGYSDTSLALEKTFTQGELLFQNARAIRPAAGGGGGFKATPIIGTIPFRPSPFLRGYWMDDDFGKSAETTAQELAADPKVRQSKLVIRSIPLAAAVTETGAPTAHGTGRPRILVFGSDSPIEDSPEFPAVSDQFRFLALSDSLDWLRKRESNLGIPPKKESTYRLTHASSLQNLLLLIAMVLVGITTLGVGVWLSRRR